MGIKKASDTKIVIDDSKVFYFLMAFALIVFLFGAHVMVFDEPRIQF